MGHSLLALESRLQTETPSTDVHQRRIEEASFCKEQKDEAILEGMMNFFITDRPLGQQEKQLIHELTMKKRQSKKSTMSEKQIKAKQQLAKELKLERRDPIDIDSLRYAALNKTLNRSYSMNLDDLDRTSSVSSINTERDSSLYGGYHSKSHPKLNSTTNSTGSCGFCGAANCVGAGGSSFSESDRSYEGATTGGGHLLSGCSDADSSSVDKSHSELDEFEATSSRSIKEAAQIRLKKSRLEQLNAELETRLYQYEYLVAQEKALLGTYNMMLFTNKGVNNFNNLTPHSE